MTTAEQMLKEIAEKTCQDCGRTLPGTHFYKNYHKADGLCSSCKDCSKLDRERRFYEPYISSGLDKAQNLFVTTRQILSEHTRSRTRKTREKTEQNNTGAGICKTETYPFYKNCSMNTLTFFISLGIEESVVKRIFGASRYDFKKMRLDEEVDAKLEEAKDILQIFLGSQILARGLGLPYVEETITYRMTKDGMWAPRTRRIEKKQFPPNAQLLLGYMYNNFPNVWKNTQFTGKLPTYDDDRKKITSLARDVLAKYTDQPAGEPSVQG